MDTDLYGPFFPPRFTQSVQSDHGSKHLDPHSKHSEQPKRFVPELRSTWTRKNMAGKRLMVIQFQLKSTNNSVSAEVDTTEAA